MTTDLSLLDCGSCGIGIVGSSPQPGRYREDEDIKCSDCGAVNHVAVGVDPEPDDEEPDVYVSFWTCRHEVPDDEPCDLCEIEDGTGVGEVP